MKRYCEVIFAGAILLIFIVGFVAFGPFPNFASNLFSSKSITGNVILTPENPISQQSTQNIQTNSATSGSSGTSRSSSSHSSSTSYSSSNPDSSSNSGSPSIPSPQTNKAEHSSPSPSELYGECNPFTPCPIQKVSNLIENDTLNNNLILYYTFENDNSQTALDSAGNNSGKYGQTSSGFNNTILTDKDRGKVLSLNTGIITLPDGIVSNLTNLTLSIWFKNGKGPIFSYLDFGSWWNHNQKALYIGASDGKLRAQFANGQINPLTSLSNTRDGNWHHAVLVGETNNQSLYLDGNYLGSLQGKINNSGMLATTLGMTYTAPVWPDLPYASSNYGWGYYQGLLDNFRIYSRPLSALEVKELYAQESPINNTIPEVKCYIDLKIDENMSSNDNNVSFSLNDSSITKENLSFEVSPYYPEEASDYLLQTYDHLGNLLNAYSLTTNALIFTDYKDALGKPHGEILIDPDAQMNSAIPFNPNIYFIAINNSNNLTIISSNFSSGGCPK